MLKLKNKKSLSKRVLIKKRVIQRKKAYNSHLFLNKNTSRIRSNLGVSKISKSDLKGVLKLLPYK